MNKEEIIMLIISKYDENRKRVSENNIIIV